MSQKNAVVRFDENGSLDMNFAGGGILQSFVAGISVSYRNPEPDPNAPPETVVPSNLGEVGVQVPVFSFYASESATLDLVVDHQGRIVIAGISSAEEGPARRPGSFAIARFTPDGNLDYGFGDHGSVTTDFVGGHEEARAVTVDGFGRVVAAGLAGSDGVRETTFAIARYTDDGRPDPTFGDNGTVTTEVTPDIGEVEAVEAVLVDGIGRIVVGGWGDVGLHNGFVLARYLEDGRLDPTFGTDGVVKTDITPVHDVLDGIAIDDRNRIVAAGWSQPPGSFAIARYMETGSLDQPFGDHGFMVPRHDGIDEWALEAVAIDGRGRIVVAGAVGTAGNGGGQFVVQRYGEDGSFDPSFGNGGTVVVDLPTQSEVIRDLAIDYQGRIVVAGRAWENGETRLALARLTEDGHLDPTFGTDGVVLEDVFPGFSEPAEGLALDPRGGLLVAGTAESSP